MASKQQVTITTSDLLTVTRAAKFLGIHRMTLWRWVRDGKIRPIMFDNQRFFHINELKQLKEQRSRGQMIQCEFCPDQFEYKEDYEAHLKIKHPDSLTRGTQGS